MLIAHAPAGYIVSKALTKGDKFSYIAGSLIFSVWPDLDLIYYYFFDKAKNFHHMYFTHLPIAMVISLIVTLPFYLMKPFCRMKAYYNLFFINWFLHLILDTFTGGIMWLYPFCDKLFILIKIPMLYESWIVSFVMHWSFIIELAVTAFSLILFLKSKKHYKM